MVLFPVNAGSVGFVLVTRAAHFSVAWLVIIGVSIYSYNIYTYTVVIAS